MSLSTSYVCEFNLCCNYRDTVMRALRQIDPEGVASRKGRRLKRRIYKCKVGIVMLCEQCLHLPSAPKKGSKPSLAH